MTSTPTIIKHYSNGGTIEIYTCFEHKEPHYDRVYACCKHFAGQGKRTIIMPRIHYKDPAYKAIYKSLIGTKYEKKCPDFSVDGTFYEHEGFTSTNSKNAFHKMCNRGFRQCENVILEDCNLSDSYMIRSINGQMKSGVSIKGVWILSKEGIRRLY